MNDIRTEITCPYCGHKQFVMVDSSFPDRKICLCDIDDGGCDKYYVAKTSVVARAVAVKIEGEESEK